MIHRGLVVPFGYPIVPPAEVWGGYMDCGVVRPRWWWFVRQYADGGGRKDCFVTWRHRNWWWTRMWVCLARFFRLLMRFGMWEVPEGGYYWRDGKAPWMHIHG